jgi:hypothetical protein
MFPTTVKTKMIIVAANPSMALKEEAEFGPGYTINYAGDEQQPYNKIEVTLPKI